ncbi:hypothetical protein [Marinobacterium litorale]|uniref:hypothetical protein n=1 Tax=Marinobacterium litorale TaxID=404770 RepID=UPI000483B8C8|nr:hypothetical protein [Marinobacterium litorale]
MTRRNWKSWVPRSPVEAMEGVVELAFIKDSSRVIKRIACEFIGQHDAGPLYKWMSNGRLPLCLILPFEKACGVPLITRYLAAANGKMLVDIPTGRNCKAKDVQQLQTVLNDSVGALLAFSAGDQDADETLDSLRAGLESLAWHHGNVQQHAQPQLEF